MRIFPSFPITRVMTTLAVHIGGVKQREKAPVTELEKEVEHIFGTRSIAEDGAIDGTWRLIGSEDLDGNKIFFSIIIKEKNRNFQKRKVLLPCGQQGRGEGSQKGFGSDDSKSNSEIPRLK
ncbi:hypothetical protein DY000_02038084 [Brassica cretica]|uniref:Plastid lipid-associated protein/fibrillin conserved domain-containing protein n=1 Tax=Brassica cretica TaxID=69181 RepID=A0ABQ7BD25_BRACR|nr:hypothetical protein DY000_02038084 [Brassica cretica]